MIDLLQTWLVIEFANLLILATSKESYWKYAYEVCSLQLYTEESSTQYKGIDHFPTENWLGTMVNQSILNYSPLLNVYYRYLMEMLFLKKVFQ